MRINEKKKKTSNRKLVVQNVEYQFTNKMENRVKLMIEKYFWY